jgi:hypothetical protein
MKSLLKAIYQRKESLQNTYSNKSKMKNIPVIAISQKTLAEAYEAALIAVYEKGTRFKTQYDKPDDPESMDCTINITIEEPETDPMIHMAFPGGIEDLKEYVMELKGFKDHWTKNMNIENTKAQMKKGVLEFCILSILSEDEHYPSEIIHPEQVLARFIK